MVELRCFSIADNQAWLNGVAVGYHAESNALCSWPSYMVSALLRCLCPEQVFMLPFSDVTHDGKCEGCILIWLPKTGLSYAK